MEKFLAGLERTANTSYTENAAKGYRTTFNPIVDMSFKLPSYRHTSAASFDFDEAFLFDPAYALKFLFYARDAREGVGERDFFRNIAKNGSREVQEAILRNLHLVPEYGRWDDLLCLVETAFYRLAVINITKDQLAEDYEKMMEGKPISLLAKWMPSINASSQETRRLAQIFIKAFGMKPVTYRKGLAKMRRHLDVVERKMSSNAWDTIDYTKVPSRANLKYAKAFLRNDRENRQKYLDSVLAGKMKMNASVIFPHEALRGNIYDKGAHPDILARWKSLPNLMPDEESTIVVLDTSASMTWNRNPVPLEVATGIALYCSERLPDAYKNKIITFSYEPQYYDLSHYTNVIEKLAFLRGQMINSNTDIEKVFDVVLKTAVDNNLTQEELPRNILIISDMEFDEARDLSYGERALPQDTLFAVIRQKYAQHGYELPHLVFWNVASRTNTIPDYGENVTLVGGYSQNLLRVALGGKTSSWEQLKGVLDSPRYEPIVI